MTRTRSSILAILLVIAVFSPLAAETGAPVSTDLYVVFFEEEALAAYEGGVPGLRPTAPKVRGQGRLDVGDESSRAYLTWLRERQDQHLDRAVAALGRRPEVVFRYLGGGNGMALRLTGPEAARVEEMPGVVRVVKDYLMPLDTDRGPALIGAPAVWDGSALGSPVQGEGVIVGIIDSGVNMGHAAFSDSPVDGHTFTNPLGAGNHIGWCDPGNPNHDPSFVCNDKLIGAWDFVDAISVDNDGPQDSDGHGSHTASTSAGNQVDYSGDGTPDMSGVAPHANVITYDACYVDPGSGQGLCPFSSTSASVDRAILDGVDVINYSIGGGTSPWSFSDIDRFFLSAYSAGIFVAASAGNSGPGASTTGHLGPWVTTVGASTLDRVNVQNELVNLFGGTNPPPDLGGLSRTQGYGPAPIVYAGAFSNGDANPEQCLSPFPPGTFSGQIVVCDRGDLARVMKGQNVRDGGAGGFVLANVSGGATNLEDDTHVLPGIQVDVASGDLLRTWLSSGTGHTATITPGVMQLAPGSGDQMAGFSSRGPNPAFDVVKPDVTNPGVNILAASLAGFLDEPGLPPYSGLELAFLSGTSMSSPHTAGCAALVKSAHPSWTPAEIKSALMSTATRAVLKENGSTPADPFDMGGGRVSFPAAVKAGLLLDETQANFLAANPSTGGDPRTLNLASFADRDCGACSFSRTVRSPLASSVTWTASSTGPAWMTFDVQPQMFTVAPGGSQSLDIVVNTAGGPVGTWAFGEIVLTPSDPTVPEAHLTVAVIPAGLPDLKLNATRTLDTPLGNGNGVAEPHEILTVEVDLFNDGDNDATGVSGVLSSTTPGVTVLDAEADWNTLLVGLVGTTFGPHFRVGLDGTVPCGSTVELQLDVSADHGPSQFFFQIPVGNLVDPAAVYPSSDVPIVIPDNNATGASSTIVVGDAYDIADLNLTLDVTHGRIGDLEVDVTSPSGTTVRLHAQTGGNTVNLTTTYDTLTAPDGPGTLGDFDGEPVNGVWSLKVADRRNNVTGQITSWSLDIDGVSGFACEAVPCVVSVEASATPNNVCGGEPIVVSGATSLFSGSDCGGTLEYRLEGNAGVLQEWSPDPDVVDLPTVNQTYTVRARDPLTGAQGLDFVAITASPTPNPTVAQNPVLVCDEVGDVVLDGGAGFAIYSWSLEGGPVVGSEQMLTVTGTACQDTYVLQVTSAQGCSATTVPFSVNCQTCSPAEVSAPGGAVPFLLATNGLGTLEFELLADPDVEYNLYSAGSIGAMQGGDYEVKFCDLENSPLGAWLPIDATTVRWTPASPLFIQEGFWLVIAERTMPGGIFEGSYGTASDGTPRPSDLDGIGSVANLGCP